MGHLVSDSDTLFHWSVCPSIWVVVLFFYAWNILDIVWSITPQFLSRWAIEWLTNPECNFYKNAQGVNNILAIKFLNQINYAFPTGSVYGFGMKRRQQQQQRQPQQRTLAICKLRICKQFKNLHIVNSFLFSIFFFLYIHLQ